MEQVDMAQQTTADELARQIAAMLNAPDARHLYGDAQEFDTLFRGILRAALELRTAAIEAAVESQEAGHSDGDA
jgi:hypothetical protein